MKPPELSALKASWLVPTNERSRDGRAVLQRKADHAQMLLRSHIEQSKLEVRKITLQALQDARARRR